MCRYRWRMRSTIKDATTATTTSANAHNGSGGLTNERVSIAAILAPFARWRLLFPR